MKKEMEGGLGIRDVGSFNLALLGKWRWRFLNESNSVWSSFLRVRYGAPNSWKTSWPVSSLGVGVGSFWWRDLGCLEGERYVPQGWLSSAIVRILGNGATTSFWHEPWVTSMPLSSMFNRLFSVSLIKDATVALAGEWRDENWCWILPWRRPLFVWEEELLLNLMATINQQKPIVNKEDSWSWLHNQKHTYTVKSAYQVISSVAGQQASNAYKLLWAKSIPLKVSAFSWRVTLDRIPTYYNLQRRGSSLQMRPWCANSAILLLQQPFTFCCHVDFHMQYGCLYITCLG